MGRDRTGLRVPRQPRLTDLWPCAVRTEGTRTIGSGELDEDAVAAQGDYEGLLAHAAALCLSGHRALKHTHIFVCKRREGSMSQRVPGLAEQGSPWAKFVRVMSPPLPPGSSQPPGSSEAP